MITWLFDILLIGLGIAMLVGGRYGITRQLALVPIITAALDAAFATRIDPSLTPWLSALLVVLQGVILLGGAMQLYQDRVRARNRQARRRRRQQLARYQAAFEQAAARNRTRKHSVCA